jgi:hypothetical protein
MRLALYFPDISSEKYTIAAIRASIRKISNKTTFICTLLFLYKKIATKAIKGIAKRSTEKGITDPAGTEPASSTILLMLNAERAILLTPSEKTRILPERNKTDSSVVRNRYTD